MLGGVCEADVGGGLLSAQSGESSTYYTSSCVERGKPLGSTRGIYHYQGNIGYTGFIVLVGMCPG